MFVNEGQAVCLDLCAQTPNYVNWPTRPRSTDDCTCPVNNNSIKSCSCVNNTDYEVSINVSKVCWNHLDRQKNNTKVFLFTEELISNCSSLEMPVRIYCKSAKFLITGESHNMKHMYICECIKYQIMGPNQIVGNTKRNLFVYM